MQCVISVKYTSARHEKTYYHWNSFCREALQVTKKSQIKFTSVLPVFSYLP